MQEHLQDCAGFLGVFYFGFNIKWVFIAMRYWKWQNKTMLSPSTGY